MSVREAGQTDDLAKSINYGEVSHFAKEFMENHTYRLLEAVVERLARAILLKWPQIIRADLELKKPWAPIGASSGYGLCGNRAGMAYGLSGAGIKYGRSEGASGTCGQGTGSM